MNPKKLTAALTAFTLSAGMMTFTSAEEYVRPGDIDQDGKTDIIDLCLSKKSLIDIYTGEYINKRVADIDQNGTIDSADTLMLRSYLLGIIDSLPEVKAPEPEQPSQTDTPNQPEYPDQPNDPTPSSDPKEYMQSIQSNLVTPEPSDISQKQPGVEYGTVKGISYFSTVRKREKRANVILPPGYDENEKYPVLYANHGFFGSEMSMLDESMGLINISGNLIARGEAEKMIIVCGNMFSSDTMDEPTGFDLPSSIGYDAFIDDLINCLMPCVEQNFSVKTGRENTAITGFSMGGRESLYIGISRPDLFGYIGAACPAPGVVPAQDHFMTHPGNMSESDFTVKDPALMPYVIMISGAVSDGVVGTFPEQYHDLLTKNGCPNVWQSVPQGGHDGVTVRAHFYNFAKALFKATK